MPPEETRIGVLALQGAFAAHRKMLQKLGIASIEVRSKEQLQLCNSLIIPGGESTTIFHLLSSNGLVDPLLQFAEEKPLFGTCAGMILMAKLKLLDVEIARNDYGRQIASFSAPVTLSSGGAFPGIFIRAPRITNVRSQEIQILGKRDDEAVYVQQGHHLACSFHPELSADSSLHLHFAKITAL